jgi:Tfp pilus assembly protein PilX
MKNHTYAQFGEKGFALFMAMILTSTLLLVAAGIVSIATRQAVIASFNSESQYAFYAADTGIECALFWDVQSPSGISAFSTTTGTQVFCNLDANNTANTWFVGGSNVSTINYISFQPDPYCAIVTVTKNVDGTTQIESFGYNTCDSSNLRRVERAVRAKY